MTIAKRPGRPRLDPRQPSTSLTLTLTAIDYAHVQRLAARDRASVQDVIRREIRRLIISRDARAS